MSCPHCHREPHPGECLAQPSLLTEPPAWRTELQQRIDAYRARRSPQLAEMEPGSGPDLAPAPQLEKPQSVRVLPFRSPSAPAAMRSTAAAALRQEIEPLAEPVILPPPIRRRDPEPLAQARLDPEAAGPVAAAALPETSLPVTMPEAEFVPPPLQDLAERVSARPRGRQPSPKALQQRLRREEAPAVLQIPLPLSASAPALPASYPVAPRELRLRAGLFDAAVVAMGAGLFAATAWAALGYPGADAQSLRHLLPAVVAVPSVLAALYLSLCFYTGSATWGMSRAGLYVAGFDGPLTPAARRRRAGACWISFAALGMGFAWIFCDPQQLTWHDSISRTFIAVEPDARPPAE